MSWVYFLGEITGRDIKIGYTAKDEVLERVAAVNKEQTTSEQYLLLAALRATLQQERDLLAFFDGYRRTDKGSHKEYFQPAAELVGYINWLRAQWWVAIDGTDFADVLPEDPTHWLPAPGRTIMPPENEDTALFGQYDYVGRELDGTPWSWMVNRQASIQDYYTPSHLIDAAREAMGDIDLDAASHFLANLRHRIPEYFDINHSAFDYPWHGRVWLNPPYGQNEKWFARIAEVDIEQLCMLSPVWAFTIRAARPVVERASGFLLLSPTPKFWGNKDGKTGSNHPHAIMYLGDRSEYFLKAYEKYGIPLELRWSSVSEYVPEETT